MCLTAVAENTDTKNTTQRTKVCFAIASKYSMQMLLSGGQCAPTERMPLSGPTGTTHWAHGWQVQLWRHKPLPPVQRHTTEMLQRPQQWGRDERRRKGRSPPCLAPAASGPCILAPNHELGPPWRRYLGSPRYVISARAPPASEGIPRQVLGMEAMGAQATKETELNLASPCLAPEDGWLFKDGRSNAANLGARALRPSPQWTQRSSCVPSLKRTDSCPDDSEAEEEEN
ncbi:hypothetical protein QTO34_019208 [Cnephaeus nilssonii]|uniref:Uncharacterized protein n=1 Tax=Cnephaeus nilssonii TaxID=3371016 RepID=A0AA40LD70_CNENI|nr:hypothetical protein QTO34_019208 [Eptesicus nilssonii]